MRSVDKLKVQLSEWQTKRFAKSKLESLLELIAHGNGALETNSSIYAGLARQHLDCADRDYRQAIIRFKDEEFAECEEFIERGELHATIARHQLARMQPQEFDPQQGESRGAPIVVLLGDAIVKSKMAVEYTNCKVPAAVKKALVNVTSAYTDALDLLRHNEFEEAGIRAESARLLLHWCLLEIGVANRTPIVDLRLERKPFSRHGWQIKEYLDAYGALKMKLADDSTRLSDAGGRHLKDAKAGFQSALDCLSEADDAGVDAAVSAGWMHLKAAEKLFRSEVKPEVAPADVVLLEFDYRKIVDALMTLLKLSKSQRGVIAIKHLTASAQYYLSATQSLSRSDRAEAARLARAAYLDLDYARQLAVTEGTPQYLDL